MELSPSVVPDAAGLKALAHPVRLRMLGLLRSDGPATATSLAARLGLNSGATSYHLRQLADHGFIVDDPERGNGRERWWAAAHRSTRTSSDSLATRDAAGSPDREAHEAYDQAIALLYADQLRSAAEERLSLPEEWLRTTTMSDWHLRLSPARARALRDAIIAVVEDAVEDEPDDEAAGTYVIQLQTFPRPGSIA